MASLILALFALAQADVPLNVASFGSGGGGVAFVPLPTGLRPYMTLQYPQHGHIFRRTSDIVVAATIGNFTMPRDGSLMGFLNGCASCLFLQIYCDINAIPSYEIGPIEKAPEGHEPVVRLHLSLGELAEGRCALGSSFCIAFSSIVYAASNIYDSRVVGMTCSSTCWTPRQLKSMEPE